MLSDEQMSNGYPFSLLNDEQMSNKVGVVRTNQINTCNLFMFYARNLSDFHNVNPSVGPAGPKHMPRPFLRIQLFNQPRKLMVHDTMWLFSM